MWGFILEFEDGTQAFGAIFPDGFVFVHEPISDQYASLNDMLLNHPGKIIHIAPMVDVQCAKDTLEKQNQAWSDQYKVTKAFLSQYDALNPLEVPAD